MGEALTWLFFVAGLLLILTELFIPGFVVLFLGLAAILVACLRWLGLISGFAVSITTWFVTSIVFLLGLRHFVVKWLPSESHYQMTDEDVEAVGTIVEVVSTVSDENQNGRIRFAGTTWPAITRDGTIPSGKKAKLLFRDNLIWTVEEFRELEPSREFEPEREKE